ncbi:52 kDa repressor of the inhibitor of the protein kinase [Oryzias melastigma]|uniref:THAP domain containing 12a n=1 Tax=Oryzias melastigma TaxID=30732 RepID=A0A3B3DD27_ORYME|nr:52 kDa repressor of the inhibitor of the protein kinase [Oryzias melastigma]
MLNRCVVLACPSGKTDSQPVFRFPHDPERSRRWAEKCQSDKLIDKSPEQLYRYYRICKKHFETSAFDGDADDAVLKPDAVPTVFDTSTPSQSSQLKRSKDTTKENEEEKRGKKKVKTFHAKAVMEEEEQTVVEKDPIITHLELLLEILLLCGQQGISPTASTGKTDDDLKSNNFNSFLKHRLNYGEQEQHDESKTFCSSKELNQLIDVCEKYLRGQVIEEVKQNGLFSLITDDPVKISGEWCLPVFVRYVHQSAGQRETFVGFLNFKGDKDTMVDKMLSEITDQWGLNLERCIGQAHSCSGTHFHQIKMFSEKLKERHPRAVVAFRSTCGLNMSLAKSMSLPGVGLVLSTLEKIESFFCQSPLLQVEFEQVLSMFYPNKDKANELKEICRGSWMRGDDAFEVVLEIIEPLLLCVDSVHDNEDMRWNDQATHNALEISKAVTDFEFIMTLIVLKNVLTVTRAFGKSLQGSSMDAYLAADNLKGVVQTLKEMLDNIDVYNDCWTNEALTLASTMEIPVRVPRTFLRKHLPDSRVIQMHKYFKEQLSVPIVNHIISEMTRLFCEDHIKILRCLSLIPTVIEQCKSSQPEEENFQMFSNDIPNAGTLSAELHCWWVKWSKKNKEPSPSSLHETLQLPDVKFFPNMLAVLRFVSILPTLPLEDRYDVAFKRFRIYMENTPDKLKSKSLAFLNISFDAGFDLDSVVDLYMKTYSDKQD